MCSSEHKKLSVHPAWTDLILMTLEPSFVTIEHRTVSFDDTLAPQHSEQTQSAQCGKPAELHEEHPQNEMHHTTHLLRTADNWTTDWSQSTLATARSHGRDNVFDTACIPTTPACCKGPCCMTKRNSSAQLLWKSGRLTRGRFLVHPNNVRMPIQVVPREAAGDPKLTHQKHQILLLTAAHVTLCMCMHKEHLQCS